MNKMKKEHGLLCSCVRCKTRIDQLRKKLHDKGRARKKISKNTAYKKGRAFEYRVRNYYEKLGYYVRRSYASKGIEDLIAIKARDCITSEVLLIQCKHNQKYVPLSKKEKSNLIKLSVQTGGIPVHAYSDEKGHIAFSYLSV